MTPVENQRKMYLLPILNQTAERREIIVALYTIHQLWNQLFYNNQLDLFLVKLMVLDNDAINL